MKHFKAHIQDGVPFRQNHFIPECELPFFSNHRNNRTVEAIGYSGRCWATWAVREGRGFNGKWQGRIHHTTEPLEPEYRLLKVGRLTEGQIIRNSRASKYKIVSNP